MRGEAGYEETRRLLAERGFVIDTAEPHTGEHFGSWWIVVSTTPRLRVIWDGRDEWAIVQRELRTEWEDLWIGKRSQDTTPSECVQAVVRLSDFAIEAQRS
jgi:hypothetical protein